MSRSSRWAIAIGSAVLLGLICLAGGIVYFALESIETKRLLAEGHAAARRGDCETAISRFDEVLDRRLGKLAASAAYANRSHCHNLAGRRSEALRDCDEAIRLNPRFVWAYEARGMLREYEGKTDLAFADYSEAIRLDPNATEALRRRGLILLARNELDKAIADLKEAIRTKPNDAQLHVALGEAQLRADDASGATASFDSAIRIDPSSSGAYSRRADAHASRGLWQKAQRDKAQADLLRIHDKERQRVRDGASDTVDRASLMLRGNAAVDTGQYDLAIECYDKFLSANPGVSEAAVAYMNRGNAYSEKGELEQAVRDYERAMHLDPKLAGPYNNRATIHLEKGDFDAVIADCTTALKLNPRHGQAYLNRALAYTRKKEDSQAIRDLQKAIELEPPRYHDALNQLAWIRATSVDSSLRDGQEAVAAAVKACELTKWQYPAYIDTLAAAHAENREFERAVEFQKDALTKLPETSRIRAGMEQRLSLYEQKKPYREE